jgi:Copper amine oxidase N-terminal domain
VLPALTFAAYTVTLDGRTVLPRARAAVVGGRVLLPVRALGNALGADVGYDGRAHTITVQRGAHVATIGGKLRGQNAGGDVVRIVNGTAYAPLRVVANAFGIGVAYQARTRTVALDDRVGELQRPVHAALPTNALPNATTTPTTYAIAVTPASGSTVHDPYPAITARFAGATSIDPRSLRVTVDGRDVSAEAAIVGDEVLLTPRRAFAPGPHSVAIDARDANGTPLAQQWTFADDFSFAVGPAPTPYPINAIWIDRWIVPGTSAFDVYMEGAPGMTGYVGVDGVAGIFPLNVYSGNAYVAHVLVPSGVNQPFARVAARITLPNGTRETIVLPQTINLFTPRKPLGTAGYSSPTPTPTPHSARRYPLSGTPTSTPAPLPRPQPTATPRPAPTATPTPAPAPRTPPPLRKRVPLARPSATPVPEAPASTAPVPKPPA